MDPVLIVTWGKNVAVVAVVWTLMFALSPVSPLCDDGSYRAKHPLICDTGGPLPGLGAGDGDGGGGGGLIGRIIHAIGGLL